MKIQSTSGKGNFRLIKDERTIYELEYANWFSGKAGVKYLGQNIELKPKNIWTSKVEIYKDGKNVGDITFTLKGQMVIRLKQSNGNEQHFIMKNNALFKFKFDVYNDSDKLLFTLDSKNNWSKLNYDYEIRVANYQPDINIEELLIYCGYAANLYLAMISVL